MPMVAMATNITARNDRYKTAASHSPWSSAAFNMVNSLMKGPNGGEPVMASMPAIHNAPETGMSLNMPFTSRVDLVLKAVRAFPATMKSMPFVSE